MSFLLIILLISLVSISSYTIISQRIIKSNRFTEVRSTEENRITEAAISKGFGKIKAKDEVIEEKDAGTKTYETQAKRGVPEYNIFLRPVKNINNNTIIKNKIK